VWWEHIEIEDLDGALDVERVICCCVDGGRCAEADRRAERVVRRAIARLIASALTWTREGRTIWEAGEWIRCEKSGPDLYSCHSSSTAPINVSLALSWVLMVAGAGAKPRLYRCRLC
jgi:hypothetical protein